MLPLISGVASLPLGNASIVKFGNALFTSELAVTLVTLPASSSVDAFSV